MKKKYLFTIALFVSFCIMLSVVAIATDWFDFESQDLFDILKSSQEKKESDVIVVVNGEKIYRHSVEAQMKASEMSAQTLQNTENNQSSVDKDEAEKEIINEKIRNIVVRQEAERKGLTADYETAKKAALESYNNAKELDDENYQFLLDYMEAMDYTEEEYIEIMINGYIKMYTRANLYDWFVKGKEGTYEQLVSEYEEYVQSLIDKADIIYK